MDVGGAQTDVLDACMEVSKRIDFIGCYRGAVYLNLSTISCIQKCVYKDKIHSVFFQIWWYMDGCILSIYLFYLYPSSNCLFICLLYLFPCLLVSFFPCSFPFPSFSPFPSSKSLISTFSPLSTRCFFNIDFFQGFLVYFRLWASQCMRHFPLCLFKKKHNIQLTPCMWSE